MSKIKQYRKRPVQAIQWTGDNHEKVFHLAERSTYADNDARLVYEVQADDYNPEEFILYSEFEDVEEGGGNRNKLFTIPKDSFVVLDEWRSVTWYHPEQFKHTYEEVTREKEIGYGPNPRFGGKNMTTLMHSLKESELSPVVDEDMRDIFEKIGPYIHTDADDFDNKAVEAFQGGDPVKAYEYTETAKSLRIVVNFYQGNQGG